MEMKAKNTLQPLFDRVLLEPIIVTQVGSIIVPEKTANAHLTMAKVLLAGPGKYHVDNDEFLPTQVKAGEIVFINPFLGNKIKVPRDTPVSVVVNGEEVLLDPMKDYFLQQEDSLICRLTQHSKVTMSENPDLKNREEA